MIRGFKQMYQWSKVGKYSCIVGFLFLILQMTPKNVHLRISVDVKMETFHFFFQLSVICQQLTRFAVSRSMISVALDVLVSSVCLVVVIYLSALISHRSSSISSALFWFKIIMFILSCQNGIRNLNDSEFPNGNKNLVPQRCRLNPITVRK